MIAYFMKLFKSAVKRITPFQIPAIAVDQPWIPLAEQTRWTLGEICNEDQYVTKLGGLYIKMMQYNSLQEAHMRKVPPPKHFSIA